MGAFDLPSIITGVVVVGILAAGVLAAVFAVIPFSQDNSAKQDLDAVRTAEGVAKSRLETFMDKPGLLGAKLIGDSGNIAVGSNDAGTCYLGLSKSGTGTIYFATNRSTEPQTYVAGTDTGCLTDAELAPILDEVGGLPVAPVEDVPAPPPGAVRAGSTTPTTLDRDGDSVKNIYDPSPNGETAHLIGGWGGNWSGELGTTGDTSSPTNVVMQGTIAGQRIGMLSENTGSYHACGTLELSGDLYCWGDNYQGQLGNGTSGGDGHLPVKVLGLDGKVISEVITAGYGTCAIADGAPYCWGGSNMISTSFNTTPVAVDTGGVLAGKTITKLVGGNQFACVLADGAPYCWGKNGYGQLGNGDMVEHFTPVPVVTSGVLAGKTITDLGAHNEGGCAIASGAAYCWGGNYDGQLGNGNRAHSSVPTAVTGLAGKTVTYVAGGYMHTCAVADGAAYCWGSRQGAMLGNGEYGGYDFSNPDNNAVTSAQPVDASGALAGKTVTHVDLGDSHVCVLASEAPYCWGNEGEFGNDPDNEYEEYLSPVAVGGSMTAGNRTLGLWTMGGSTLISYLD